MEKETGARIQVRGKGAYGRAKQNDPWAHEPLHVMITAETQDSLDKACTLVEKLLVPTDDEHSVKAQQLKELAIINGTTKDLVTCRVCGAKGHKIADCPERTGARWTAADVLCTICGSANHIDRDCRQRGAGGHSIMSEYESFMKELNGDTMSSSMSSRSITAGSGMLLTGPQVRFVVSFFCYVMILAGCALSDSFVLFIYLFI